MPGEYTFKTAPLGKHLAVEVTRRSVTIRSARGRKEETVDLARVTRARVASMAVRYTTSRWFDLWHPAGRTRLACNGAGQDEHAAQYEAAVDDVLRVLAQVAPEARILGGVGDRTRWVMFAAGALTLAAGIGLPVAAWLTDVGREKLLAGLAPSVAMLLVGSALVYGNRPWVPEQSFPAREYLTARGQDGDQGPPARRR